MRLNLIINVLMVLLMSAITGVGILMKRVLIPGQSRWSVYGRNVDLSWLGMDRHAWGEVHFVLGGLLLALVVWHVIRHWNSVVCALRQLISGNPARRIALGMFAAICLALLFFPFVVVPEVTEIDRGEGRWMQESRHNAVIPESRSAARRGAGRPRARDGVNIRGSMTLGEVSGQYGVSSEYLKNKLGLPMSTSDSEKLGDIRRGHGIRMSEVQSAVENCSADDHACRPK